MKRTTASPRYRALARRYAQLLPPVRVAIVQPSEAEKQEMQRVSAEMADIEMTWATLYEGGPAQSGALA